jgi:hypothetical protein
MITIYDTALRKILAEWDRVIISAVCDGDLYLRDPEVQAVREMVQLMPDGRVIFP